MKKLTVGSLLCIFVCLSAGVGAAEKITLATLNWQPFYGEDLPENGFFAALSREAFKRAGYEMELEFMPWKRALEMAKKGKYDGLLGAYFNEDREKEFFYTDSIARNEESFFQKKGKNIKYENIDELKQYKVGGLRGSAPVKALQEKGMTLEEVPDDILNIKKLVGDRIDLIIAGKQQLFYNLNNMADLQKFVGKIEAVEPPFKSYDLYCPISKKRSDGTNIVTKFNKALQEMREDGSYDEILKRFGQQ